MIHRERGLKSERITGTKRLIPMVQQEQFNRYISDYAIRGRSLVTQREPYHWYNMGAPPQQFQHGGMDGIHPLGIGPSVLQFNPGSATTQGSAMAAGTAQALSTINQGSMSAALSGTSSTLFDTWPFSALQRRETNGMSAQKSFYLQQQNARDDVGEEQVHPLPEYPASAMFGSPISGSPSAQALPSSTAMNAGYSPGPRKSQMTTDFNNPGSRHQRSVVEERRRMFELGLSPATANPLATVTSMAAGAGGNVLVQKMPQQQRGRQTPGGGQFVGRDGRGVSTRGSVLATPLKNFVMESAPTEPAEDPVQYFIQNTGSIMNRPPSKPAAGMDGGTAVLDHQQHHQQVDDTSQLVSGMDATSAVTNASAYSGPADDDRRYASAWQFDSHTPSASELSRSTMPNQNNRRSQMAMARGSKSQHVRSDTVPLVGAWTINRWLSVLSDNSSTSFMVWSIYPYSVKKREHSTYPGRLMFSQTFTTTRGYRMRAMVALNGTGAYAGRYMSVFWQIMPGPDDNALPWPMKETVTVRVLPAGTNDAFSSTSISGPVRNPRSFSRPEGNKPTPPWGFKKFINHHYLESGHFIQADTLWLAFEVTESGSAKFGKPKNKRPETNLLGDFIGRFFYNTN